MHRRADKTRELLLAITAHVAKVSVYQQRLLTGDAPTITASLVRDVVMNAESSEHDSFVAALALYHLSQNPECGELLVAAKGVECALYVAFKYTDRLKHCYVALSCIANLCVLADARVIRGRECYLHSQHEQIVHEQKQATPANSFPLFALNTHHCAHRRGAAARGPVTHGRRADAEGGAQERLADHQGEAAGAAQARARGAAAE